MRLLERGIWGGFEAKWLKSKLVRSRNSRIAVPFTTSKSDSRQRFRLLIHSGRQADGAWISTNDPKRARVGLSARKMALTSCAFVLCAPSSTQLTIYGLHLGGLKGWIEAKEAAGQNRETNRKKQDFTSNEYGPTGEPGDEASSRTSERDSYYAAQQT